MSEYRQIKLIVKSELADTISDLLEQLGSLAVTYEDAKDDPILEPLPGQFRLWPNTAITGLFSSDAPVEAHIDILKAILGDNIPVMEVELEDRDWVRAWMDSFVPMRFGSRLWICPTNAMVDEKDAIVVSLDPGLAFGTGTHPTTALCLEYLDSQDLNDKSVIDFGCGSGILAIAALKLGAKAATGLDIDEQAIIASSSNAALNNVQDRLTLINTNEPYTMDKAPYLVANILSGPLCELEEIIAAHVKPQGHLALSGLLSEQVDEVLSVYERDFDNLEVKHKDGWALISGTKK